MSNPEYTPERAAYFAALYQRKRQDPDFLRKMADKARARRAADPTLTQKANAKRRADNPEAERLRVREWFAKNPDKRRAYEANRRARAKDAGGRLSPGIIQTLMTLQRGKCACCKANLAKVESNLDHIIPLARGGRNDDANMQLLCQPCNNSKHAKHPVDFMQSRGYLL